MTGPQFSGSGGHTGVAVSNTASGGGGSGPNFGGAFAALSIMQSINSIVNTIMTGKIQKAQAEYNATIMEGKAKWVDMQKDIINKQYERFKGRFISKSVTAMAGAGLMPSGSPMAVLQDSLTNINVDKAISMANLEQQKLYDKTAANMHRVEGRNAVRASYINSFSELLSGATNYAKYKYGMDLSQGATRAGKQN